MRSSLLDIRTVTIALATVSGIFTFFVAFEFVSDRVGGWPLGYVASGVFATVAFVVVLPIARRYLAKPFESMSPLVDRSIADKWKPSVEAPRAFEETIFARVVKVGIGRQGCWSYKLPIQIGELLEGTLREVDGQEFSWMIVSKTKLTAFLNGEDIDYGTGEEDIRAADIDWKGRKGRWYLVVDAYLKQNPRKVQVELRRIRT